MKLYSLPLLTLVASVCSILPLWAQKAVLPPGIPQSITPQSAPEARIARPAFTGPIQRAKLSTTPTQRTTISSCNIVRNPTFDDQLSRPTGGIDNVPGSAYTREDALAVWHCADNGTVDHFATNAPIGSDCHPTSTFFGGFTPHNNGGPASSVNGCAGLYASSQYSSSVYPYREYLT